MSQSKIICLLITIATSLSAQKQKPADEEFIIIGLGAQYRSQYDQILSPLRYAGWLGSALIGQRSEGPRWHSEFLLSGSAAWLQPDAGSGEGRQTLYYGRASYRLAYAVWHRPKHRLYAGLQSLNSLQLAEHSNFANSRQSLRGFFSYGPSLSYRGVIYDRGPASPSHWAWRQNLFLPIGSYLLGPGYLRLFDGEDFGTQGHYFLPEAWHIQSRSELIYRLSNGNEISLSYRWEYLESRPLNQFASGGHEFFLALNFRL